MAAVHGVEANEASRFIDHTLATPWETLVSDIEVAIRSLSRAEAVNKVDIYYYGLTYRLEKRRSTTVKKVEHRSKEHLRDFTWLLSTYNINWFMILSHASQSSDYHASYRQTVLSAFITAVKSVGGSHGLSVPIFFSFSYVTDISKAKDLVGYQLLSSGGAGAHRSTSVVTATEDSHKTTASKGKWCRLESHLCPDLHHKLHLTCYDGLRKVFQNQLCSLRLGGPTGDSYYIEAEFVYKYSHHDIYGYLHELRGRTKSPAQSNAGRGQSGGATGAVVSNTALFANDFIRRVAELTPSTDVTMMLLSELSVVLAYRPQPHSSIIDNLNFTTYVPSKQPPHCWAVHTTFTRLPSLHAPSLHLPQGSNHGQHSHQQSLYQQAAYLRFGDNDTSATALSTSWLSTCVRKLLAFYLLSVYCTKRKINVETMSAEIEATEGILNKSILERILEVLSDESKEVFYSICRYQIDSKLAPPPSASTGRNAQEGKAGMRSPSPATARKGSTADRGDKSPVRSTREASPVPGRGGNGSLSPVPTSGLSSAGTAATGCVGSNLPSVDDWQVRSDRHRGVVDVLFSSASVYHPSARTKSTVSLSSGRRSRSRTASRGSGQASRAGSRNVSLDGTAAATGATNVDTSTLLRRKIAELKIREEEGSIGDGSGKQGSDTGTSGPSVAASTTGGVFDVRASSSVGLWFSMFSVMCATAAVDAHDMATIWSKCIRRAHIATEDEQPLPTFTPPPSLTSDAAASAADVGMNLEQGLEGAADEAIPICSRTLWSDAIDHLHDSDTHAERFPVAVSWPDLTESVVIQKLQLLQFCVTMCGESPIYRFPQETVTVTVPVKPEEKTAVEPTAETTAAYPEASQGHEPPTAPVPMASTDAVVDATPSSATQSEQVRQPALFRRLPLTEDVISMNNYLARKVNAKTSRSSRDHPTLKVQLQFPSIMSDVKAFKAANPELGLDAFCAWYGFEPVTQEADAADTKEVAVTEEVTARASNATGETDANAPAPVPITGDSRPDTPVEGAARATVRMPLHELQKVWTLCDAVACEDQGKPLFQWEKEAEKAFAYLEAISAVRLATEMLSSGMRMAIGVMASYMQRWLGEDGTAINSAASDGSINDTAEQDSTGAGAQLASLKAALRSDLAVLVEQVELAVQHLELPRVGDPTAAESESQTQVSVAASILVDSVAGLLQKLEGMLVKLQTLDALLVSSKGHRADTLVHAIARRDGCTAETDVELSILYELARSMRNYREQLHDWQSNDGRELGRPARKTFTCKLEQPRTVPGRSVSVTSHSVTSAGDGATFTSHRPRSGTTASTTSALASSNNGNGNAAVPLLTANSSLAEIFLLEAAVEHDLLRLAMRVPER